MAIQYRCKHCGETDCRTRDAIAEHNSATGKWEVTDYYTHKDMCAECSYEGGDDDWEELTISDPEPTNTAPVVEVDAEAIEHDYLIRWEIDITATDPCTAAERALEIQRDPESTAVVFNVFKKPVNSVFVDLSPAEHND